MELGQVGVSWATKCDFWHLLEALERLALILNFNKSMLESDGNQKWRPGSLPAPFQAPPATLLEGLEKPKVYFSAAVLHNLLLLKFKLSST